MDCSNSLHKYYMFYTTLVAALTAGVNLIIIFWMGGFGLKTTTLDSGLGLAAIGITTFFGVSLSSSIFEKYREPETKPETKPFGSLISNVVVGKGIMRKGLAASLVMTYIVLIGLSFSAGTLDNPLGEPDKTTKPPVNGETPTDDKTLPGSINTSVSINLENIGQFLNDNKQIDKIQVKKTDPDSKAIEELILTKEPDTLVEHFTIVISVVIGFYFGANTLSALLKSRKGKTSDDLSEILKVRLAKGEIEEKEYKKLKALIKE